MKYFLVIGLSLCIVSCQKDDLSPDTTYYKPSIYFRPVDTINNIFLDPSGATPWIAGDNWIFMIEFNHSDVLTGKAALNGDGYNVATYCSGCFGYDTARHFYLKYVGTVPLLDANRVDFRTATVINYTVDPALLNKPVFEAHYVTNDSLFQTVYFGSSASVLAFYYVPDTAVVPRWAGPIGVYNDSLTKVLSHFFSPQVLGNVPFQWGNTGSF